MATEVDDQGRLYIPKRTRERYGERFRIVELDDGIKLVPVPEDPVEGLRAAMEGLEDVTLDELKEQADREARQDALR
jgi:bifunctional DNA-binding transcriptional regulator/antitoxin component of YhaV-PrlF toxin-antitoxin module